MFSSIVLQHWIPDGCDWEGLRAGELSVTVDSSLPANRSVMILENPAGGGVLTLTPELATTTGLVSGTSRGTTEVRTALSDAGIAMHDPDHVFYLTVDAQSSLRHEPAFPSTRRLTAADTDAFDDFADRAPTDDLDEAFVELGHSWVFGTFVDGRLAAAASMYPWAGTRLADLGVITLPEHRGRGLGRETVRALSARALADGYEPQYRCQTDNAPSVALARASGFTHFGTWHVIQPDG